VTQSIEKWDGFEGVFEGPAEGNPYLDVEFSATFRFVERVVFAPGFYNGHGQYRVRFMPNAEGVWSYTTSSNAPALHGRTGDFLCTAPGPSNHGPVRVRNRHHFAFADGTPYFPFGTTCYAWTHQPVAMQEETLTTLPRTRFNKIRMGVFPKHYTFNQNEPLHDVFERQSDGAIDFDRPNPAAFANLERRIADLRSLGIQADVIVFHPYDRWGYCSMTFEQDLRYVRYLAARLGGLRNVWWSLANEYDFLLDVKPVEHWDRLFQTIEANDPARRLKSIHNGEEKMNFDHRKPWVDHVCIQSWDVKRTLAWRDAWGKPVINDEPEYEGDISLAWGNISARELVHRFWITVTRGGYAGHGETYAHPKDLLWWAKGGNLRGESWKRIGFLRDLIEADVVNGLTPLSPEEWPWTRVSAARDGDYHLIYLGEHQPAIWAAGLPLDDGAYDVDVIDTWEMTIKPARRLPSPVYPRLRQRDGALSESKPLSTFAIELPGRPYQAIRVRPGQS
jgi:hypothetical protein